MMIRIPFIHEIVDYFARENFKVIQRYTEEDINRMNFKHSTKRLTVVGDNVIQHGLKFRPKDALLLSVVPSTVTVTFKYDLFTNDSITVNISGSCEIRYLLGSYGEI
jgi:hypothetical protein